jgi:hypothetical protein
MSEAQASGITATMRHVRQAGLCARGVRGWFAGHDRERFTTFCREGVAVEWLESLGDAFALEVAACARADAAVNRG